MSSQLPYFHRKGLLIGLCVLWFSGTCSGGTIFNAQIQEQVLLAVSPPISISYDSGQVQPVVPLSHEIVLPSTSTVLVGAGGLISGNDIQGLTEAQSGQAFMDAFWQDGITVGGLAPGTPVSLRITNSLTSHVLIELSGSATVVSDLRLFLNNPVDLILTNTNTDTHNGTQTASQLITLLSGDPAPFVLDEHLALRAISNGIAAEADAPNDIFIDVLTPGATLTSQSGVNYSSTTATPEPAMALPVLACLAGVVICGRRRTEGPKSGGNQ
jgi:hypothetical protein